MFFLTKNRYAEPFFDPTHQNISQSISRQALFRLRFRHIRQYKSRQHRRGYACGACGERTCERAHQSLLDYRLARAVRQQIAEPRKRNSCPAPGKIDKLVVNAERTEYHTADNISDEYFGGGKLCAINEDLTDHTKQPAYKESPQKFQIYHPVSEPNGYGDRRRPFFFSQ